MATTQAAGGQIEVDPTIIHVDADEWARAVPPQAVSQAPASAAAGGSGGAPVVAPPPPPLPPLDQGLQHPPAGSGAAAIRTAVVSKRSSPTAPMSARLRIEYFSDFEAQALSWFVYIATLGLLAATLALVLFKFLADDRSVLFQSNKWYIINLSLAIAVLSGLLATATWFAYNLYCTQEGRRHWSFRRLALCRDAGTMLLIQIVSTTFWVVPYALTAFNRCSWFEDRIAWMSMVRWTAYNCIFFWTVITARACTRYRGPNPPASPDEQLVMDITPAQKLRVHAPMAGLWLAFEAIVIVGTYDRLLTDNDHLEERADCQYIIYNCEVDFWEKVLYFVEMVFVTAYGAVYVFFLRRAFRDHAELPFARYRLSNLYIRLVARHGVVAFFMTVFSVVVVQLVRLDSCWSYLDGGLGIAPVQMALSLLVVVQVVALMPKNVQQHDTLSTWNQEFSWTQQGLPAAIATRDCHVSRGQGRFEGLQRFLSGGRRIITHAAQTVVEADKEVSRNIRAGLVGGQQWGKQQQRQRQQQADQPPQQAQQASAPPPSGLHALAAPVAPQQQQQQTQQQRQPLVQQQPLAGGGSSSSSSGGRSRPEPMFCLELAIRLFHWSKYSYRHWRGAAGGMDLSAAQRVFEFNGFEEMWDRVTDTRALLGWRDGVLLVAFRGTASRANAITDLKLWKTAVLPRRYRAGRLLKAHAGFYQAYTANDDRQKMLSRIGNVIAGFTPGAGLQLYLTGHSLGGALAVLAAYDLQQAYPHASTCVYTFGAPRVGNHAFACEYRSLVPNSWGMVNDQDPVPRMPSTGFRHCCHPVVVNAMGDIIVRPSYFERSVIERSGLILSHHKMMRYALSMAAVIKAQFSSSKWLPHGKSGAEALAGALDLGATLLVRHMTPASLRNPDLLPESSELPAVAGKSGSPRTLADRASSARTRLLSLCADLPTDEEEEGEVVGGGRQQAAGGTGAATAAADAATAAVAAADGLEEEEEGVGMLALASGGLAAAAAAAMTAAAQEEEDHIMLPDEDDDVELGSGGGSGDRMSASGSGRRSGGGDGRMSGSGSGRRSGGSLTGGRKEGGSSGSLTEGRKEGGSSLLQAEEGRAAAAPAAAAAVVQLPRGRGSSSSRISRNDRPLPA